METTENKVKLQPQMKEIIEKINNNTLGKLWTVFKEAIGQEYETDSKVK